MMMGRTLQTNLDHWLILYKTASVRKSLNSICTTRTVV